jgi:chromate reductase
MEENRFRPLRVLGLAGSLRRGSYNRALLRAARELAPDGVEIDTHDLSGIPFYDGDVEAEGDPEPVALFKQRIRDADALLIVTPEYNGGIPGVLKNALDWASRPPRESPLVGKPVAIMGASPSPGGTARAQAQLAEVLERSHARPIDHPLVRLARAPAKFDGSEAPRLEDAEARRAVRAALEAIATRGVSDARAA